jgi:hypothetical protein
MTIDWRPAALPPPTQQPPARPASPPCAPPPYPPPARPAPLAPDKVRAAEKPGTTPRRGAQRAAGLGGDGDTGGGPGVALFQPAGERQPGGDSGSNDDGDGGNGGDDGGAAAAETAALDGTGDAASGDDAARLADELHALRGQQGIFELLLPDGGSIGVVVSSDAAHIGFLLSAADERLSRRLQQSRMELQRRLGRRIHDKDVQVAVL